MPTSQPPAARDSLSNAGAEGRAPRDTPGLGRAPKVVTARGRLPPSPPRPLREESAASGKGGGLRSPQRWLQHGACGPLPAVRVVGRARGKLPQVLSASGEGTPRGKAEARPLPALNPAGTPYLRGLAPYGTAPTLSGDAPASATASPCCTAKGLRAEPGPLRGARAAPE